MNNNNRTYTPEFKEEAIKIALSSPTIISAARSIGMPEATLHCWVQRAKQRGESALPNGKGSPNIIDLQEENKQLKKKLARLEMEKSILKKAASYFAKELG